MTFTTFVFWGATAAFIALDIALLATLAVPGVRGWPPSGPDTWSYTFTWTLFAVAGVGVLVVGGLDAGRLGLTRWLGEAGPLILGSTLFLGGTTMASYAMGVLGCADASGWKPNS